MNRRQFLGGLMIAGLSARAALGQVGDAPLQAAESSSSLFASLRDGKPVQLDAEQLAQRVFDSPAPAGPAGRWEARAPLPVPRSEMAWAAALGGRMHVIGGYGEGAVARPYHHVYDPVKDRWLKAAPLPRGANHVAVAADADRVYAFGGFVEQNQHSDRNAYAYDPEKDRWAPIAPLPRPRGAAAAVAVNGRIYLVGGASEPAKERASVGWNEAYDPKADRWTALKPLPGARDHAGIVAYDGKVHLIGGRFNTFEYNTGLHHVYLPDQDTWIERAPLPTPRSGHGLVVYRDRFFAMGGEQGRIEGGRLTEGKVFGQMESYDPERDSWQHHAAMPTPRHAVAAAAIEDWIYVAGGGAVLGGAVQSAVTEAFTLA